VINLVPRYALSNRAEARVKYGSFDTRQGRVDVTRVLPGVKAGVGGYVEYTSSDNHRDNAGMERLVAGLRSDYLSASGRHRLSLSGRYFDDSLGVPGPVPAVGDVPVFGSADAGSLYDHQLDENYSLDLQYRYQSANDGELRLIAFWEKKNLDYKYKYHSDYGSPQDVSARSIYNKRSSGLSGHYQHRADAAEFAAGVDWLSGSLRATQDEATFAAGTSAELYSTYNFWSGSQNQTDVWASNAVTPAGWIRLDVSGRLQFVADRDVQQSYNLGLRIAPDAQWAVKLGYGFAFRFPNLTEQFADEMFVAGNERVGPETSQSVNGTLEYASEDRGVSARLTVFHQEVDSLIQYQYDPVSFRSVPRNVDEFRSTGLDLGVSLNVIRDISVAGSVVYQNAKQTHDGTGDFVRAYYVPDVKARLDIGGPIRDGRVQWHVDVTHTSRRSITMYGGAGKTIDGVYEFGASLAVQLWTPLTLRVSGRDLTDEARPDQFGFVPEDGDYPGPGRRFMVEIVGRLP
jgi:hypothetical protein